MTSKIFYPQWEFRVSSVAVPRIANAPQMEYNSNAHSETAEVVYKPMISGRQAFFRFITSLTHSKAPSYDEAINAVKTGNNFILDVMQGNVENTQYGGKKIMFGLSYNQELWDGIGAFSRLGWNDGKYASWAFTEIDNNLLLGLSVNGKRWNRKEDTWGITFASNGISQKHQEFLKLGGIGFILGDGNLNYHRENIIETYYSAALKKFWSLSFDYQFVINPGYNSDRGPVHVFAIRSHFSF